MSPGEDMADKNYIIFVPNAIHEFSVKLQADGITVAEAEQAFEKEWFILALEKYKYNQCKVADAERIHRNTLARRLDDLGVTKQRPPKNMRPRGV